MNIHSKKIKLRYTLALPIIGLLLFIALGTAMSLYFVGVNFLRNTIRAKEATAVENVHFAVKSFISEEVAKLSALSKTLPQGHVFDDFVREHHLDEDIGRMKEQIKHLYPELGIDLFELIDYDQRVLYRAHNPGKKPGVTNTWGVAEALTGQKMLVTAKYDNNWAVMAITPIYHNDQIAGAILIGTLIDNAFAQEIADQTYADVSLGLIDGIVATSLLPYERKTVNLENVTACLLEKRQLRKEYLDSGKAVNYAPVSIGGQFFSLIVGVDTADSIQLLKQNKKRMLQAASGIFIIALLFGALFVLHLVRPLRSLRARAEATIKDISGMNLRETKGNEVKSLVYAFDSMVETVEDHLNRRKRAEENLKQTNEQLEESTQHANQFAQQADSANEAKSEFLASMSHEIRTPLNSIIGFGELLAEEDLNDEQKKYVDIICTSSRHLVGLINDILDFSKIEAGKLDIEIVESSLEQILADIDSLLRPMAIEKGIEFEVVSSDQLPKNINTDPARLRQCLINLANNAIKFTEQGHVYVNVSLEYQNDTNPFIRFDVEDTGVGIETEKQQNIFDAFAQADASTNRQFGGTGLGLAITKQLAELLGGALSLTSEAGKGSVFTLLVPAQMKAQTLSGDQIVEDMTQPFDSETLKKLNARILVAEDNPSNRLLIETLLKKAGCEPVMVSDGAQALDKARSEQFDLVIMDMNMPVMNGYVATSALRIEGYKTPIIALTANAMAGDAEKCFRVGCDAYLPKPVDRERLYRTIVRYVTGARTVS